MAKIGLPKGSGKWLKVREKSVKSQGISKWILSGNPAIVCLSKVSNSRILLYLKQISPPLLTFERVNFAKFQCFSAKYWTAHRYFHKTGVYCALASKNKINTRLAFVY